MKYILALDDAYSEPHLELFNTKEDLFHYLDRNSYEFVPTFDQDNIDSYTDCAAAYIACQRDSGGHCTGLDAFLRVVK